MIGDRTRALEVQTVETGRLRANCYVVSASSGDTVVIDPGGQFEAIETAIEAVSDRQVHAVLCTHGHFDHLMAAADVSSSYRAPFHLHEADTPMLRRASFFHSLLDRAETIPVPAIDVPVVDGMVVSFGELRVEVVHTPGHSPGSSCYEIGGELFTGDTLGSKGLGRSDLPGGDAEALRASFRRLIRRYPPETVVRPGHGPAILLGDLGEG